MAKQVQERSFAASRERLFAAVVRTAAELGYSIQTSDSASGVVSFNTGMSMRSWSGQNMTVTVVDDAPGHSKLVVGGNRAQRGNVFGGGGQVTDWGEKGKITAKFLDRLETVLRTMPETASPAASSSSSSAAAEIAQLAILHKQGDLTDEEFAAAKAKLLS